MAVSPEGFIQSLWLILTTHHAWLQKFFCGGLGEVNIFRVSPPLVSAFGLRQRPVVQSGVEPPERGALALL